MSLMLHPRDCAPDIRGRRMAWRPHRNTLTACGRNAMCFSMFRPKTSQDAEITNDKRAIPNCASRTERLATIESFATKPVKSRSQ
jgi:hypothetical protein